MIKTLKSPITREKKKMTAKILKLSVKKKRENDDDIKKLTKK